MRFFGHVLLGMLKKQGMSQREFARRVGRTPASVNMVIKNKRVPDWRDGDRWARALGLSGDEAREFIEDMALADTPPPVQLLVARLRRSSR